MRDFRCGLPYRSGPVEVVIIESWGKRDGGEIPRACLEALGIDCAPLDRRDDQGRQGTVWIRDDQSKRLRRHEHWRAAP